MDMPLFSVLMGRLAVAFALVMGGFGIGVCLWGRKSKFSTRLTICASVIPAYILFYVLCNMAGIMQVKSQLGEMRRAGLPVSPDEIIPSPKKSLGNGALFYKGAYDVMRASGFYDSLEAICSKHKNYTYDIAGWSEEDRKKAEEILNLEYAKITFDLFRQGANQAFVIYHHDNYEGPEALFPELNSQRALCRAISMKASYEGFKGNLDGTYSLLKDAFGMVRQHESGLSILSFLVNIACTAINISILDEMLPRHGISDANAKELIGVLDAIGFRESAAHAIERGTILYGRDVFKGIMSGKYDAKFLPLLGDNTYDSWWATLVPCSPFVYQDYACYLEYMRGGREALKEPYWRSTKKIEEITSKLKNKRWPLISINLTSWLPAVNTKVGRIESEINAAKLALACHIYKNRRGMFPESLEQLKPEILEKLPLDPMSGQPFEYHRDGDTFQLSCSWFKEKKKIGLK